MKFQDEEHRKQHMTSADEKAIEDAKTKIKILKNTYSAFNDALLSSGASVEFRDTVDQGTWKLIRNLQQSIGMYVCQIEDTKNS